MDENKAYSIVKNYVAYLKKNNFNIEKVYIFGSYAKGSFKEAG